MPITLPQRYEISAGDTETVSVNFTDHLDAGELLSGSPTVVEVTTTDLTLGNKAVNSATYVESHTGDTVAIGAAVQFSVSGGTAYTTYRIRVTVNTDATPARTFVRDLLLCWK